MHEYSLVRSLLRRVEEIRQAQAGGRVLCVRVSVGEFSGIEPELLLSAYRQEVQARPDSESQLLVERVPLLARCRNCTHEFAVQKFCFLCPECMGQSDIIRGEELRLESVTLETTEVPETDR